MARPATAASPPGIDLDLVSSSVLPVAEVLDRLDGSAGGLTAEQATTRLARVGPNAVRDHKARAVGVLRQDRVAPCAGAGFRACGASRSHSGRRAD